MKGFAKMVCADNPPRWVNTNGKGKEGTDTTPSDGV